MTPLETHQQEIQKNRRSWESKPLLQQIYAAFYQRILGLIDTSIPGRIVEIGSGNRQPQSSSASAISTDLFANPWLDMVSAMVTIFRSWMAVSPPRPYLTFSITSALPMPSCAMRNAS